MGAAAIGEAMVVIGAATAATGATVDGLVATGMTAAQIATGPVGMAAVSGFVTEVFGWLENGRGGGLGDPHPCQLCRNLRMNQVVWATKLNAAGTRAEDDFYATPHECVTALLPHIEDFPQIIWEPACGDGSISRILLANDRYVISSDIVNRGYPHTRELDFLAPYCAPYGDTIVTNPPYKHAEAFIRKAFELRCTHIAMLLKSNFWHARRGGLFEQHPPSQVLPLAWRPDFTGAGSPFLDVVWTVWRPVRRDRVSRGPTTFTVLTRPSKGT
jgi:hypothetical protein